MKRRKRKDKDKMPQKGRRIILVEDDRSTGAMIVEIIEEETPHYPHPPANFRTGVLSFLSFRYPGDTSNIVMIP